MCEGILNGIKDKLRLKIKAPPPVIAEYVNVLRANALIFDPGHVEAGVCRDSDDLMILGLVIPGNADALVTGDKDLLVIKAYKNARIMTLRAFQESSGKEK